MAGFVLHLEMAGFVLHLEMADTKMKERTKNIPPGALILPKTTNMLDRRLGVC